MTMNNETYFTDDGTYGNARGLIIANTETWTDEDWQRIEEASDNERIAVAYEIIQLRNKTERELF
jgi:hypothetical protein